MRRAIATPRWFVSISFALLAPNIPTLAYGSTSIPHEKAAAEPSRPIRTLPRVHDLFAPLKVITSPSPVKASVPPPMAPPPQAPRLPFRFVGQWQEDGKADTFFLGRGKEILATHIGETLDTNYRLEKFDGTQLHLIYLPLNARQTLFVGNNND